jgi:agmatinase
MRSTILAPLILSLTSATQYPLGQVPQQPFWINDGQDPIFVAETPISGLNTFASIDHAECLGARSDDSNEARYDIAILGAPHDITVTGRPGARYGPSGIRTGSNRKTRGYSFYTGRDPFDSWAKIVDCGDAPMDWLDSRQAIRSLDWAHRIVSGRRAASTDKSVTPRILMLGGDHTTTLSALRSAHKHWGEVSVIHFDSHIDTWEPSAIGGNVTEYSALHHGTFLHFAHEEGLILNSSIHAGLRAPLASPKGDMRHDAHCGFGGVSAREIDKSGIQGVIDAIKRRVGDTKVYISVDIDVLDPAFAPATGTPEPGGWITRELLAIIEGLEGLEVVGADVVEVAPVYDAHGETTTLAAAEVARTLIDLMVVKPVKSLDDLSEESQ